ncbi:hypothetical protein AAY473_021145 [Plecturocebus cupreus]
MSHCARLADVRSYTFRRDEETVVRDWTGSKLRSYILDLLILRRDKPVAHHRFIIIDPHTFRVPLNTVLLRTTRSPSRSRGSVAMMLSMFRERLLSMDSTTDASELWDCRSPSPLPMAAEEADLIILHQPLHVAKLHLQLQLLLAQSSRLPPKVADVALKHAVLVAPGRPLLLGDPPGLQHLVLLLREPHLADEGGKLSVEGLDLLLLLGMHGLDVGVHFQIKGAQQALADHHSSDTSQAHACATGPTIACAPATLEAAAAHSGEA